MSDRVLISMSDNRIAELIALEADMLGIKAKLCEDIPKDVSGYGAVIFDDTRNTENVFFGESKVIFISKNGAMPPMEGAVLEYPFLLEELRRELGSSGGASSPTRALEEKAEFLLDREKRAVSLSGKEVTLSENEFTIFFELYANTGSYVSRERLDELLGIKSGGNMTDVYICHLRKKIEELTRQKVIYTARGKGYMMENRLSH
ncbi:MAG: winged helix-turn-helix transcriptional regulator [Ruminococcaceae bacterium]|nr:winged helix-turn-helix transcriptional regulator [Oscillospiraceae bacterium]